MDPSPTPWRVLEDPPTSVPTGRVADPDGAGEPKSALPQATLMVGGLAAILALGAVVMAFGSGSAGVVAVDGGAPLASGLVDARAAAETSSVGPTDVIVVEVVGAISHPGVYRLEPDARIGDLIQAAGGYGPRVDADRAGRELNLAAPLHDGVQVRVPSRDDPPGSAAVATGSGSNDTTPAGGLIDINLASDSELDTLPGVGPVTVTKLLTSREEQPFVTVDDLLARKLVGQKTFDGLKDLVTVH
jgi:competence protein ComEA